MMLIRIRLLFADLPLLAIPFGSGIIYGKQNPFDNGRQIEFYTPDIKDSFPIARKLRKQSLVGI